MHGLAQEARDELFGKLMIVDMKQEGVRPFHPSIERIRSISRPKSRCVGRFLDDERNKFAVHKEWWGTEYRYRGRVGGIVAQYRTVGARYDL